MSEPLLIARTSDTELFLLPGMANRHGLITGATVESQRCAIWRAEYHFPHC